MLCAGVAGHSARRAKTWVNRVALAAGTVGFQSDAHLRADDDDKKNKADCKATDLGERYFNGGARGATAESRGRWRTSPAPPRADPGAATP